MLNTYALEQAINEQMRERLIPGMALAVVKGQEVIYAKGFGVTSVEEDSGLPVTPQTLFRIGSVTKPLVGTAIMRLVQAGKLELDRPVREYIDWFRLSEDGMSERITPRLLMSHRTGLPSGYLAFGPRDAAGLAMHVREEIPTMPLIAEPGTLWFYSNPGINVLGYLAEVVYGKPFATLMHELVFEPLAMQRTTFDPTVAMTYPFAQAHDLAKDKKTLLVQHRVADHTGYAPCGFAMSTMLDLANFALVHLNQGRFHDASFLAPELVAEMHTQHVDLLTYKSDGYGLTFRNQMYKEQRLVAHNGFVATYSTRFWMAPEAEVAVMLSCSRANDAFADTILFRVLDEVLDLPAGTPKPQAIEPTRAYWSQYIGTYVGVTEGLAEVTQVDTTLTLMLNGVVYPLHAYKEHQYFAEKPEDTSIISVSFLHAEQEPAHTLLLNTFPCQRVNPATFPQPNVAAWARFVGQYKSKTEILTIRIEQDRLLLHSAEEEKEVVCVPIRPDSFTSEWGVIEFLADHVGAITVLRLAKSWIYTRIE